MRQRSMPVWFPVAAMWIAPAIFAIVDAALQPKLHGESFPPVRELIWRGGDWFLYAFITPPVFWLARRWPIARPHVVRRVLLHLALALAFCVVWAVGGKAMQALLAFVFDTEATRTMLREASSTTWDAIARDVAGWILITLPFGVVVYSAVAGLAHAIRYVEEVRQRDAQLAEARLNALQARLNPHFLFNTLNTVAVYARDGNGRRTAELVEQLSDVLRRTLSSQRTPEVPLAEELDLVRLSLSIEAARFSDRLRPTISADSAALQVAVPSFAIQHLVENAIRHGISRRSDAGAVAVVAERRGDRLVVTVSDDGPGPGTDPFPTGHGLENTRERLAVLYGDRASLTVAPGVSGGTVATLEVPWRLVSPADTHA